MASLAHTQAPPTTLDQSNDNFASFRVARKQTLRATVGAGTTGDKASLMAGDERLEALPGREVDSGYGGASEKLSDGKNVAPA